MPPSLPRRIDVMKPRALVLAAGRSTRIAPLADGRPKPLLDLGGRSLLGWNLAWLAASGITDIWINLHHEAERIRAAVGDGAAYGVRARFSYEPVLLGTAGAWRALASVWNGTSLVIYGDNFMRFDLHALLSTHRAGGRPMTVAVFDPAAHPNTGVGGGRAAVEDGRIVAFAEGTDAAGAHWINAGAYALEPGLADTMAEGFLDFGHDLLPALAGGGAVTAHVVEDGAFCLGVDTPARYERAVRMLADGVVAP
jgi:NDP-sugar pyrophosphorylase family protein